jgi:mannose-6-phosphate isomerase-like protein (cupin superfamily)
MAEIALAPGEVFEHQHAHDSTTELRAGEVRFEVDGALVPLEVGTAVVVPAGASHVTTNVGAAVAVVLCGSHPRPQLPKPER